MRALQAHVDIARHGASDVRQGHAMTVASVAGSVAVAKRTEIIVIDIYRRLVRDLRISPSSFEIGQKPAPNHRSPPSPWAGAGLLAMELASRPCTP